ncbi:MAG TPA: hypothetical protein VHM91_04680 [Verrucomicrobiales bacterium]|nr:hypothetical protein [Verrucomicrobiales bacterium]
MRIPWMHLAIAVVTAAIGWRASLPSPSPMKSGRIRPAAYSVAGTSADSWQTELSTVRTVAATSSKTAWIKWAFTVPDADIPAAIARLNPHSDFHALGCLYARWVKLDPSAAWTYFRTQDISKEALIFCGSEGGGRPANMPLSGHALAPRLQIAEGMVAAWMTVDPTAAQAFAAKLAARESAEAKELAVTSCAFERFANTQTPDPLAPGEAAAAALQLPASQNRASLLTNAAVKWLESDPAAACAWIRQLPAGDRNQVATVWEIHGASPQDQATTLTMFLNEQPLTKKQIERSFSDSSEMLWSSGTLKTASAAVRDWMLTDPAAARKWLASLPENDLKPALTGAAAGALAATDAKAALALVNQAGSERQFAVKGLMAGWVETDARAALDWAGKIEDAFLRDACREIAAASLAASDPALAIETARSITDPAIRGKIHAAVRQNLSWNPAALSDIQARFPGDGWAEVPQP